MTLASRSGQDFSLEEPTLLLRRIELNNVGRLLLIVTTLNFDRAFILFIVGDGVVDLARIEFANGVKLSEELLTKLGRRKNLRMTTKTKYPMRERFARLRGNGIPSHQERLL